MKIYFTTSIQTVKINGVLRENIQVVSGIQSTSSEDGIPQYIELPQEYSNANILGMAYLPNETPIFQQIDEEEIVEETQLDRIEKGTNQLLADIQSQAIDDYTLELMENGLL